MKKFKEFRIFTSPINADLISGLLWELDINGVEEKENFLLAYADENSDIDKEKLSQLISSLVSHNLIENFKIEEHSVTEKNWNEEWEKNRPIIEISERIIIKPSFREYTPRTGQIVITIDPKMSFGTGEHQSTKLILLSLEKIIQGGEKILDIGTGTGILSIAALKLGAGSAFGIDKSKWCIENARENIITNNVEDSIEIKFSELSDIKEKNFDIIAANIERNILLDIAEQVKLHLKKNGILILSGLLEEDEEIISKKYNSLGFSLLEKNKMDEWISIIFKLT